MQVHLYKDDRCVTRKVHHLVLEAFDGPCPEGMVCRHLNGNPADNRAENLKWGTEKENNEDKIRHGTSGKGSRNSRAKLSEEDVLCIKDCLKDPYPGIVCDLARRFGVRHTAISRIKSGTRWGHLH